MELTNFNQSLNDGVLQEPHIIQDSVFDPEFCQTQRLEMISFHCKMIYFCVTSQSVLHLQ